MKFLAPLALLVGGCGWAQSQSAPANVAEQYLFAAANQDRLAHHLPPVSLSNELAVAARMHALQMVKYGAISHQFNGEAELATRAAEAGAHFSLVTENVAESPDAAGIENLWMASSGHRANLLDATVDSMGISVIRDKGEYYAVEDFAHSVQVLSILDQEAQVTHILAQTGVEVLVSTPEARQTCTMQQGFAGKREPWFVMRYTTSDLSRLPKQLVSRLGSGKYHQAVVGACVTPAQTPFSAYNVAVLLYP